MTPVRRIMVILLGASALLAASNSVIFALLGNLQDRYGFSDIGLGMITAAGFGASFVVQLTIAPLADRGHPKRLLLAGTTLSVAGNLAFAASSGLWSLIGARALIGAASGCFLPAARALVASLGAQGQAERLGRMGSAELGGFVMGPVIGGALVGPLGVRWPFLVFCLAAMASFIIVALTQLPELARSTGTSRLAFDLLRLPRIRVAMLVALALAMPIGMYDALWDRFLTDLGASDVVVGLSLAIYAVPFVLFAGLGGRLADRAGALNVALRSFLLIVPLTAAYAWFHTPWAPITIGILEAFVQAAASPAAQSLVARAAPPGRASAAQGLAGATNVLTSAGVALVASALYGAHGARVVFGTVAATAALCALTAWFLSRRSSAAGAGQGEGLGPVLVELGGDLGPDMSPSM